ncbi:TetR/AcrR family transcriptional regulator [Arthrobacter sp. ISL-28]|uniref:TetR/AcrR family transcriptional regulator n=1 Tax=Arthrobacter sp. ISL-28 TaxID=2819108 RepID=UPI001BED2E6B|nr:TetR/AcrR family transcriptional regulator [Arthrobacter sp. ISL-28]MBT2522515.1 TetR/AcrR family transcriptional regulator [Arthrobacter sp. ISL-28]
MGAGEGRSGDPREARRVISAARRRAADPARPETASRNSEVRLQVLQAAGGLIDRLSYSEVTIDAVARASGVSKSTLYRYWPSRQVLVLEAFTYTTNLLTQINDTGDVSRDLYSYLVALTRCLDDGQTASTVANLLAEAIRSDDFALLYRQTLLRERRQGFLDVLEQGRSRGQIRPDADLGTVIDALYGAIHHRLISTAEALDPAFLRDLTRLVIRGSATPAYVERLG